MFTKNYLPIIVFISVAMAGCKKQEVHHNDSQIPTIVFNTPAANEVFSGGQTVQINGRITDNYQLQEVHLEITNTTSGAFLTHEHFSPDSTAFTLLRNFVVQGGNSYKITIGATDEHGNMANASTAIRAN